MPALAHSLAPVILEVFAEVLGKTHIAENANFFEIGGDAGRSEAVAVILSEKLGERGIKQGL